MKKSNAVVKPPIEISAGSYLAKDKKGVLVEIRIIQVVDNEYVKYDDGLVTWTDMTKFVASYALVKKLLTSVNIPQLQELGNFRDKYLKHPEMPQPAPIWYAMPSTAPLWPQVYCSANT